MRISIISINYRPELTGISVYTTGLAEFLAEAGHDVHVQTAFPYYPGWKKREGDRGVWYRRETVNGVTLHRHYQYVPSRPTAAKRMLHELSFVVSATIGYLLLPKADCTVIVSPPLFVGIPVALLAKLKGSRTVFHVQDLQPDAAVALGMLKPGPLTRLFYFLEGLTYRLVDTVSTIGEGMRRRIAEKGVPHEKIILFRNWANDDVVTPGSRETALRREWGLGDRFVVLYAGNMGVKQGLDTLLECADLLRFEPDIVFAIVGDGGEKTRLMQRAAEMKLHNVVFHPLQPIERLAELLATGDVSVIPQKAGVKDIVVPSKLGNILSSGRPVIAAATVDTELGRMLAEAQCGVLVEQGSREALAAAIIGLHGDPLQRGRFADNGRRYVEAALGKRATLSGFVDGLRSIVAGGVA